MFEWSEASFLRLLLVVVGTSTVEMMAAAAGKEVQTPIFLEPIQNVTFPAGRDVRLACVVDHLGSFKVAWIQKEASTILTVGNHVITRNPRVSVTHDGHRTWFLGIRDVQPRDAGTYMCQINTETVISQIGYLNVNVPPCIKDDMTSRDMRLVEGADVTLACSARGSPVPSIRWRREDKQSIRVNGTFLNDEAHGPLLRLRALKRTDMAAYLCIASNGVPPSVSKRIKVEVEFQPLVYAPLQLVHAHYGQQMDIECYIEAFPPGLSYWKRPSGIEILHSDSKYKVTTYEGSGSYKSRMVLTIRSVQQSDIGEYNCISNNSQGGAEQEVLLSASMPVSSSQNTISKGSVKEGVLDRGQVDSEAKPSFEGIETLLKESFETNSKTSLLHGSPAPNNRVVGNLGGGDVTHEDLRSYKDPTTRQIHYNSGSHDFSPRQTFDLIAAGAAASVHNSVLKFCVQAVPAPACVGSHMTVREGIGLMKTCFAGWRSGRSFAYSAIENGIGIMETKSDECTSKRVEDCAFIKKGIGILQTDYAGCATGRNCTNSIRGEIVKEGTARQRVLEISFDLKVILSFFLLSAWSRMM